MTASPQARAATNEPVALSIDDVGAVVADDLSQDVASAYREYRDRSGDEQSVGLGLDRFAQATTSGLVPTRSGRKATNPDPTV